VNQAEALRRAAVVLRVRSSRVAREGRYAYAARLTEAAEVLERMERLYVPGSDAWVAVPQ
jgi:hypothetical protein